MEVKMMPPPTAREDSHTLDGLNAETKLVFVLNLSRMVEEISDMETKAILRTLINHIAMSLIKTDRMH
jgi:hypothetical protein